MLLIPGHELEFAIAGPTGPLVARRVLWVLLQSTGASPEWTGTTDGKGRITVRGLPSGQLLLAFVEIDGRFRRFFTGMVDSDGEHEVRVREGEVVHGQALSATRQPLPGVRVVLWPRDPGAGKPAFVIPPRVTYTDHGGRFAFDPVAGEHAVAVDAGRHGAVSRVVAAAELGDEQVLQLPGTPGVKGRVLDAEGRPAPGAWVTISRTVGPAGEPDGAYAPAPRLGMQALCTLADENGEFAFTGLPAGVTWSAVGALMRDDVKYNATAAVPTGGTVELRLGLQQQ